MPATDLQQVQIGLESTWGTGVTPTLKLLGVGEVTFEAGNVAESFEDLRGSLAPAYLAALVKKSGKFKMKGTLTHDMFVYICENMFGTVSPTGTGPYVRAYSAPLTTAPTRKPWTIVDGTSSSGIYQLAGGLITKLEIEQKAWEEATFSIEGVAKEKTAGTLQALSDTTVTVVTGDQWTLYDDAWAGTIGTTAVATTAMGFKLKVESPVTLVGYLGSLLAGNYAQPRWKGSLDLTLELNATSKTTVDAIVAATSIYERQLRLKGAVSTNPISQIDFAGFIPEEPETFGDEDGVQTVEVGYEGLYNSTLANWFKVNSTTSIASV